MRHAHRMDLLDRVHSVPWRGVNGSVTQSRCFGQYEWLVRHIVTYLYDHKRLQCV